MRVSCNTSNDNVITLIFSTKVDVSQPTISAYIKEMITDTEYSYDWEIDTVSSLSNVADLENMLMPREATKEELIIMKDIGFECETLYGILDAVDDKGNPPMYFLREGKIMRFFYY